MTRPTSLVPIPRRSPTIDFSSIGEPFHPSLTDLIHQLAVTKADADAACKALSELEERHRDAGGKLASQIPLPKVRGGMTKPMTIIIDGKRTDSEPGEWFFRDRKHVKKDGSPEQLAEWDRQAKAARRAFPKELRDAEREQLRALDIWIAAERELAAYKPASAAEAVELLTLAGKPQERDTLYMDVDQWALQDLVANCAAALREAFTN